MTGRAVAYCRQSVTRDAESLSLETQERIVRRLAADRGIPAVEVFVDADRRGWDEDRPGLRDALARCDRGGISHFVVHDMSRLARSLRLTEQYVWRLSALGIELVSHLEPHVSTPLYRQLLGAIHEEQTRTISANWRRVLAGRAARGLSHGVVPFGYAKPTPGGPIVPDPEACETVGHLFLLYSRGVSVVDLAADLSRRGVPTPSGADWWTTQTIAGILDNPIYAGMVSLNNERTKGVHEPIISSTLFEQVAARRASAARPLRHKGCSSWLEGHVFHACGARMSLHCAEHFGERPRFRCRHLSHPLPEGGYCRVRPAQVAAWKAEPIVARILAADLAAILPMRDVLAHAKEEARRQAPGAADDRKRLDADAARIAESRRRAEELYLSGVRDRAWFDAQEATSATEAARIDRDLAALPQTPEPADIRADGEGLRDLAGRVRVATAEQMGPVLAELGVVVVGAEGVTVRYHACYGRHLGMGETTDARPFAP